MKPRDTLKSFFKRGEIPKQEHFEALIDTMVSQYDDSVFKPGNDPLSLRPVGESQGLLHLYATTTEGGEKVAWKVEQKSGENLGLSIADGSASRLFIEVGTGNVGVGTDAPASRLHVGGAGGKDVALTVAGRIKLDSGRFAGIWLGNDNPAFIGEHDNREYAGLWTNELGWRSLVMHKDTGNVGIGTDTPKSRLHVRGNVHVQAGGGDEVGLVVEGRIRTRSASGGVWLGDKDNVFVGVNHNYGGFWVRGPGWGGLIVQHTTGNVGIGTDAPKSRLEILDGHNRTGTHPSDLPLYVTGDMKPAKGVEFRHWNASQGIGFGYNTVYATGTNSNQSLRLRAQPDGFVDIERLTIGGGTPLIRMVTGVVLGNGNRYQGTGFTCKKLKKGTYEVKFDKRFRGYPIVTATMHNDADNTIAVKRHTRTFSGFQVFVFDATGAANVAQDAEFSFIAIDL